MTHTITKKTMISFICNPTNQPLIHYLIVTQVNYSISNLLSATLIPELSANKSAGATGNIQFRLVPITTIWTFPNKLTIGLDNLNLAVITTNLTIIRLDIQLCVLSSNSLTHSEYEAADDMLDELYQERERLWLKAMEDGESCYL